MKKILITLLLIIFILLLVSCNPKDNGSDISNTTQSSGATAPQLINIVYGGVTEYKIVRPDKGSDSVIQAAINLRASIIERCDVNNIEISDDFEAPNFDTSKRYKYEILVGLTNRNESLNALSSTKYNDFIIAVFETRIVILGGSDEKTVEAVSYFIDNYIKGNNIILDASLYNLQVSEYEKTSLSLMGTDISEYKIVYASAYKDAAITLSQEIGKLCGVIMNTGSDNTDEQSSEIIIGSTKRGVDNTYGYDDYSIKAEGTKIYIGASSVYGVSSGCRSLLDLITDGGKDIPLHSIKYEYIRPDRSEYINDISLLSMHWSLYWKTPEWMLNFDEKYAAMHDPDGRLMSCLHRGDMVYYPENSIEGIISAILMGGDMVEIDLRKTKDGIIVLMHDQTLTRTTDFLNKAGKNGLPTSANLSDWTYAELQQLNLRTTIGGTNSTVTEYKIPTFDEVMKVCSEKVFLRLDKLEEWNYTSDIWPVIQKYKAYSTVIFTWHPVFTSNGFSLVNEYKSKMQAAAGTDSICFVGCKSNSTPTAILSTINYHSLDNCVRLTDFNLSTTELSDYLSAAKNLLSGLKGKVRIYVDAHGSTSVSNETHDVWQTLNGNGINLLLVNEGLELCKFIGENYNETQY